MVSIPAAWPYSGWPAVFAPSWQTLDAAALRKALTSLGLAARADDDAILLVPSSISTLARANDLISFAKFAAFLAASAEEVRAARAKAPDVLARLGAGSSGC